jgi:DivIVA domain-containing protein
MSDGRRPAIVPSTTSLSAEQVARRRFAVVRKGFDPADVEAFLEWVAAGIEAAGEREEDLRRRLAEAERRAANPEMDEATVTAVLGQETARIIRSAHDAAAEVTARATESAERILREAEERARSVEERAAAAERERAVQAEEASAETRRAARDEAARHLQEADREAEEMREAARAECREMVREAQELRGRILGDMARRRRILLTQVEQLRAGRGSLSDAVEHVRDTIENLQENLRRAEDEARAAADAAARRVAAEPEPSVEQLRVSVPASEHERLRQRQGGGDASMGSAQAGSAGVSTGDPEGIAVATATATPEVAGVEDAEEETAEVAVAGDSETAPETAGSGRPEGDPRGHQGRARERRVEPSDAWPTEAEEKGPVSGAGPAPVDGPGDPMRDDDMPDDDRRMSSLRIIRRSRRGRSAGDLPAEASGEGPEGHGARPEPPGGETEPHGEARPAQAVTHEGAPDGVQGAGSTEAVAGGGSRALSVGSHPAGSPAAGSTAAQRVEAIFAQIRQSRLAPIPGPEQAEKDGPEQAFGESRAVPGSGEVSPSGPGSAQAEGEAGAAGARAVSAGAGPPGSSPGAPDPAHDQELLRRRDSAIATGVTSLSRKLKRVLQDDQNGGLDRLRSTDDRSPEAVLTPREEQIARVKDVGFELMEEAAREGAGLSGGRLKERMRRSIAEEQALELAEAVVMALRGRLEETWSDLAAGDEAGLAAHISASYREWKGHRIERLAGDHLAAAFSRGVLAASSPATSLRWVVDDNGAKCPDCDDNALAGPVRRGDRYPTGQAHPPAHAGCRCLLVPDPA